jgi:hypothetical protein
MSNRLFFATPCYRGDANKAEEWIQTTGRVLGIPYEFSIAPDCPWLDIARAQLVYNFRQTRCDAMLFRDDDLFFEATTVRRMLESNADVIVSPYKIRGTEQFDLVVDMLGRPLWAGLGCTMIRRHVIDNLWNAHYDELHFRQKGRTLVSLFDRIFAVMEDKRVEMLKEDHAFFHRVREAGFPLQVLDDVFMNHAGTDSFYTKGIVLGQP